MNEGVRGREGAWLAATTVVVGAAIAVWLSWGVPVGHVLRYLLFLGVWVVVPGVAAWQLVSGKDRLSLDHACIGIPFGYALLVLGFVVAAEAGLRSIAPYVSPVVGLLAVTACVARRSPSFPRDLLRPDVRAIDIWLTTAIAVVAMVLMAFRFFPAYPLPENLPPGGADYQLDISWHIGNAAALKEFWPPEDPRMIGTPLRYYLGAHILDAVASTVTGIPTSTFVLRLDVMVYLSLAVLQLYWLGRECSGKAAAGVAAAAIAFLAGDVSILHRSTRSLYFNLFVADLYLSPTFALGLITFVPILVEAGRWLSGRTGGARPVFATAVLLVALCWAKVPALPVVIAACAGMGAWEVVFRRRAPQRALVFTAVSSSSLLVCWHWVVMPGGGGYLQLDPLATLTRAPAWTWWSSSLPPPLAALGVFVGHAPLALAGFIAFVAARRWIRDPFDAWIVLTASAGAGAVLLLDGAGAGQLWFWFYGLAAFSAGAGAGLLWIFERMRGLRAGRLVLAGTAVIALVAMSSFFVESLPGFRMSRGTSARPPGPLTADLADALRWVRANTPPDAILAINHDAHLFGSALAERRFMLENDYFMPEAYLWRFSKGKQGRRPDQERRELMRRIFQKADADAIRKARDRFGVTVLLVDKRVAEARASLPDDATELVFENSVMSVHRVH